MRNAKGLRYNHNLATNRAYVYEEPTFNTKPGGYAITTATLKVIGLKKRIRGVSGGTSAGKTIAILQDLIDLAQRDSTPTLTSICAETYPHLRRGVIRDFKLIMQKQNYYDPRRWNVAESRYTFENDSIIEFFSLDSPHKVRGPRRDRLFINEANTIPKETFEQLEVRTTSLVYLDWNPTHEFWWYTDIMPTRDVDFLTLTYKDNEALDEEIVKSIEARRGNASWWRVYGLGLLGEVDTRIYTGWTLIDEVPEHARLARYGLDFGYTNDPTAIVAVYEYQGGFVLDQVTYAKRLLNGDIELIMREKSRATIIADSAEPKSIDELIHRGLDVLGATKGKGSITWGIAKVQSVPIWVTKKSVDLLREYRGYLWRTDKDGRVLQMPGEYNNHAMDAIRYAITDMMPDIEPEPLSVPWSGTTTKHGRPPEDEGTRIESVYDDIDLADLF